MTVEKIYIDLFVFDLSLAVALYRLVKIDSRRMGKKDYRAKVVL